MRTIAKKSRVVAFNRSACSGNPGPGGWGAVLTCNGATKELKGGERNTTNNRMELMAAISALEALRRPCNVDLFSDSQYLRNGMSEWLPAWKENGWKTSSGAPVKNKQLWKRLEEAVGPHKVRWESVWEHAHMQGNNRAYELAREGMLPSTTK